MKAKENYKQLSKRSTDSFYQGFSYPFANHLKLHSRWYMFLRKRRSFEYRHCRCLARIAIALNRCSVYGHIQYTNPPEHLCLLNKLEQLVLVRVLANQKFADASVRRNEQKGVLIAGVPFPLSPIPLPFSLPPYPLLLSTPGYITRLAF